MTTRLKVLSGLLVFSIIYAGITFFLDEQETTTNQMITAQVNNNSKTKSSELKNESNEMVIVNNYKSFKTLNDNNQNIVTWGPDPFKSKIKKRKKSNSNFSEQINQENVNPSSPNLDYINIESVAFIGNKAMVIINGQRFHEGDRIQNLFIDKIQKQSVTFTVGNTKIIKNVGK